MWSHWSLCKSEAKEDLVKLYFRKEKKKDDVNSRISKEILFNFSFSRNQRPAKKRWSTAENDKKEEEKYCHKQTVTLSIYKPTEIDTIQGVLVTECRYEKYCNLKQSWSRDV